MDHQIRLQSVLKRLPDAPGIYLFYSAKKELVYVGKATSLKNRVASYFRGILRSAQDDRTMNRPIEEMIHEVMDIKHKETDSVLEAVILESIYIKKFQPKYNVLGKDDKSWNYIVISKDRFPKVVTMRERELSVILSETKNPLKLSREGSFAPLRMTNTNVYNFRYTFGPYPGLKIKETLKILRKLFRYSSCKPNQGRPCLYYQMGQCLGVCTGEISAAEYKKKVIRPLVLFLSGKKLAVIKLFEREMKRASREEHFEEAARLRNQLASLRRIQDVALLNKSFFEDKGIATSADANRLPRNDTRIEGYDISNLGATEKVASMVVFNSAGPVKSEYRKFIIRTVAGQSDVGCIKEVLERRLKRSEWPNPSVILVDGGRPQVNAAKQVLQKFGQSVPLLGIAKGAGRKRNDIILGTKTPAFIAWASANRELLIRVRDEAHRFAISFHRKRLNKRSLDIN